MVQLLLVTLLGILVFPIVRIQSVELNSPYNNNNNEDNAADTIVDEYEDYQYEDGEPYAYPDFGLKNPKTKLSTTNSIDNDNYEHTKTTKSNSYKIKPSTIPSTTTTTITTTKKFIKPSTTTTTTVRSIPPSKRPKYTRRPITFFPTTTTLPSTFSSSIFTTIQTDRPFKIHINDHHDNDQQKSNSLLIPVKRTPSKRKRIPSQQTIYKNDKLKNLFRNSTKNYSKFNENNDDDNDSNDSLEKSESNYTPNKYKFDSSGSGSSISSEHSGENDSGPISSNESYEPHPYNEYSFNTYHFEDTKPKTPTSSNEEHYLFTTDMLAPKYNSNENNFGYFKSTGKHKDTASSFEPVHGDFKTDLSVSAIELESYPIKLKSFKQKQPNLQSHELKGLSSNEDLHHHHHYHHRHNQQYRYKPSVAASITVKPTTTLSTSSSEEIDPDLLSFYQYESSTTRRPVTQLYSSIVAITPGIASMDQIKLYNDDQKSYYESVIEHQLRSSTNLADKAKLHQFLKAQEDEKIEQQSKREQHNNRHHNPYQPNFYLTYHGNSNRGNNNNPSTYYHHPSYHTNTHPHHSSSYPQKPLFRKTPDRPKQTPGLRHFRTPSTATLGKQKSVPVLSDRSYNFPFI